MTPRGSRAVTFDLDNTLVRNAFEGWVIPEIAARLANGRSGGEVVRALMSRHERALERGDAMVAYDWQAHADVLATEAGMAAGSVDVAELVRRHSEPGKVRLLHESTMPVLRALRAAGWRVVILTNGFRAYQEPVLRVTGLWSAVDEVITTDDFGYAKPDRRAFTVAFGGVPPAVHVGDRIDHDVWGARRAAAASVLMQRDAPFTGLTADLDEAGRAALREYVTGVAAAQGVPAVAETSASHLLPDAVAADLAELPSILDELGKGDMHGPGDTTARS